MATAASSAVSSGLSPLDVSEEKTNGTRLIRLLIDGGTHALRNFLHSIHPPATLQQVLADNRTELQSLRSRGVIFKYQWKMLFPPSGDPPDSKTFDITLLHLLLREICHLKPFATGPTKKPAEGDNSPEASIIRIKWFRNELYHSVSTGIPNREFEDKWREISLSLEALEISAHRRKIQSLKTQSIDHGLRLSLEEQAEHWSKEQDASESSSSMFSCLPDKLPEGLMFGRSQEIEQVREIVQGGHYPVTVITGGPGFGKTTVANVVAHELAKPENDRTVIFCTLLSKMTLNEVATEMIQSCGAVQTKAPENPEQWLKDWSKQIRTQVTFVLDNADDVIESDDRASFLKVLVDLRRLSKQKVTYVITTRKIVKGPEMQTKEVRLSPLSPKEAKSILVSRVYDQNVRKKLFKTEQIVHLCGCIPLALCVVGSLLLDYSEEKLIKNLKEQPLNVLEADQISVEKAIKTSFDLLTKNEQDALVLMSVFPGSFNADAAEAILKPCISSGTLPISVLRSLKNRSLVEQPSSQRYQLHSLIKAFAKKIGQAELLAEGERLACAHFMLRLDENASLYWSKDSCKQSLDSFNEDRHNFEHFLQAYAQGREKEDRAIVNSCEVILVNFPQKCMYLEMCVLPRFYIQFLEKLLRTIEPETHPVHTVELFCLLGHEMRKVGEKAKYEDYMKKAEKLYSENKLEFDKNALSEVIYLHSYARLLSERKIPDEPMAVYETALRICQEKLHDHPERAATLMFAGRNHKRRKENDKAREMFKEALDLFKECLGEHFMTALCLKDIADFLFSLQTGIENKLGSFDNVLLHYKKSLDMLKNLGMDGHKETILTLKNFGICHKRKGNFEEARNMLEKAERVAERELVEDHMWKVKVKTDQALLFDEEGKEEEMVEAMKAGLQMCYRLGKTVGDLGNRYYIRRILYRYPETFPVKKYPR